MRTCLELTGAAVDFLLEPLRSKTHNPSATMNFVDIKFSNRRFKKHNTSIRNIYGRNIFKKVCTRLTWQTRDLAETLECAERPVPRWGGRASICPRSVFGEPPDDAPARYA